MRTREEIMKDTAFPEYEWKRNELALEVLLDIRELLMKEDNEKDV